jgi:hypothetical protein
MHAQTSDNHERDGAKQHTLVGNCLKSIKTVADL